MIGFTQGFHCVYSPLWVHDYAPKDKKAGWMSYLQGAVPIGITAGYLAGSVSVWSAVYPETVDSIVGANNATEHVNRTLTILGDVGTSTIGLCNGIYCWRWPFIFQFVVVLPFSLLIFCVPNEHIRTKFKKRQSLIVVETLIDDETVSGNMTPNTIERVASEEDPVNAAAVKIQTIIVEQGKTKKRHMLVRAVYNVMQLLRHRVYLFVVLGLSALFFVVAGVQFWTTLYLSTNTNDSAYRIHWSYLVVSGTGPILGVFFGGWLIDQFGGYAGRYQEAKTLRICVVLGILAVAAAIPVSYVHNTLQIAVCLWIMLFAGGSILPACSGIVIASTPRRLRPLASSFAYTCYNLLGYAASNYIPGLIMDFIIDQRNESASHGEKLTEGEGCDAACTYRVGFRIVLLWSIWALLCLLIATYFSCQNAKKESLAINMTELNGGEIVPVNVSLQAPCVSATGGATVDAIPPIRTTQTVL
jgi:MFS family permease